jgi:proline iminopeptidase
MPLRPNLVVLLAGLTSGAKWQRIGRHGLEPVLVGPLPVRPRGMAVLLAYLQAATARADHRDRAGDHHRRRSERNPMSWRRAVAATALVAGSAGLPTEAQPARFTTAMTPADTVFVAAPTGENAVDRASMGRLNRVITGAAARDTGFATGADGVRLFYRIEGSGPDTVVVLHGGPALGLAYLAPDLEPLGREHTLLFYDQRGVGRSWSERDVDLSVDRHVEDLEALRSHFGIGRLRLVGHSWGAMLAARYAAAYPDRVERMLFIDPMVPAKTPYEAEAGAGARRLMQERLDSVRLAVLDSLVRAAPETPDPRGHCRTLFELLVPLYFTDAAAAQRSRGDFCTGSDEAIRARSRVNAAIMGSVGDDVRPLLSRVRSPVLIVHGGSGAIPTEAMHAWADALPDARLMVIPDAGHYLHVDRPDVFFPAALEFLRGSWPAGARDDALVSADDTASGDRSSIPRRSARGAN